MTVVDLRSDVLTSPTEAMWTAMRSAEVGWALVHEDDNVARLETLGARLLGKEASVFTPTCSMANLVALMTLGPHGTQVVLERQAHIAVGEAWGLAYVCGLFAHALDSADGILSPDAVEHALARAEMPGTSLLVLENTHTRAGGAAMTAVQTNALADVAHRYGASVHLDGARLLNAAAALGIDAHDLTLGVDTVSLSLNKGLGAPMGALLAGSTDVVVRARLNLKRLGGASIHQAGVLAAAAIVALDTAIPTLAADNRAASELAARLTALPGVCVRPVAVRTNIVTLDLSLSPLTAEQLVYVLCERGVRAYPQGVQHVRFVTHRSIRAPEIERVVAAVRATLSRARSPA
ncbi:MAG: threonine aldolase family protein [Chloroflexota bacterium]